MSSSPSTQLASHQEQFLAHILACGVLRFGEFKTKSGRLSPYFFDAGRFDTGLKLATVADVYARALDVLYGGDVDNLYGPAYKGIPLAVATAQAWAAKRGKDIGYTFNRKEVKDHGEGGRFVGEPYAGTSGKRVVIIEDVITGGTSIRESVPLLRAAGVNVLGALVGIDREERGVTPLRASAEIERDFNVPVHAVLKLSAVVDRLTQQQFLGKVFIDDALRARIDAYRATHGA